VVTALDDSSSHNEKKALIYVDLERIREDDGYVYYWQLDDYLKPFSSGAISAKAYYQADCGQFSRRRLSLHYHKQRMGENPSFDANNKPGDWTYPVPESIAEHSLKLACTYVKLSEENRQIVLQSLKEKNKE